MAYIKTADGRIMRGKNIWNIVRNHYLGGRELSLKFYGIQGYAEMFKSAGHSSESDKKGY